jgi:hypothetical protein
MDSTSRPTAEPLLDDFAARVARRDQPPPLTGPNPFEPAQVRQRIASALAPLLPHSNARGRAGQAWMLYAFLQQEALTAGELAGYAGIQRVAGSHAHTALVQAGLLRWAYEGPRRRFRLTRYGEDWLLAVGKGEAVPARPA